MDKKLHEITNLGEENEIMNSKRQVLKEETWSRGTNSHLRSHHFAQTCMRKLCYLGSSLHSGGLVSVPADTKSYPV